MLFAEEPLAALLTPFAISVLAQSVADLEHFEERVEMGLGLFISKAIIDKMGGTLSVDSGIGEGSTFHVSLPLYR